MAQRLSCIEAQRQLQQIKTLEQQLDEYLDRANAVAIDPNERERLIFKGREVKITLQEELATLVEQVNPFEKLFNLKEQYQSQVRVLEAAKILEERDINGERVKGITDIEGNFQPMPTQQEVIERLFEKKELLKKKKGQGFGKVRLVPFGMSLEILAQKYKQALIQHAQEGRLFTARKDQNDPGEPMVALDLNINDALYLSDEYKDADKTGKIVYGVTQFDQNNHGGQTKSEILKQRRETKHGRSSKGGWDIIVLEDDVNIPREGEGDSIGERKQIETNKTPEQYLTLLQTPQYQGEVGLTPEETLIHALTELVEKNEVIDDYQGNGSISYNIGAYFPMKGVSWSASGLVPFSYFRRNFQQADLYRDTPTGCDDFRGLRSGVRV